MGREILIVWAGRHRRRGWEDLCAGYRRRIERQTPLRDLWVKARAAGGDRAASGRARRSAEGRAIEARLPEPCWTIALDPQGRTMSSEELAAELRRLAAEWPHPVAFLIGSDLGLDPQTARRARRRLSLGPMVLGHELARLVLYEQIYRALAIERGIKYHRQPF